MFHIKFYRIIRSKELATFDKNMKRNKNSALNLSDIHLSICNVIQIIYLK